ncbi:ADP compounds hydrolase NudE [Legionella israelensis]|uniref:NUDIX hydrolase n=1 Tax=Legionella israelensis TaxID=454 RepID=A0A0W0V2H4_9GAMM|nr:ADP compounds hydrolase NudE [Legionella israelensis]KTD14305.1 NUDIX hydrolase [Legionella israelensis]QBS10539.1 ADP compounds hydrolase NudE [Legionella israelensis]QDP72223.1 ADP compounds hydrolase NudE [Legionella israelensis]SCX94343.1 ADP-ribose diphosphatase [Legionella israelensis DSM 19235]STX57477.1 NUDIX hydrolase [Legionella israelensis]
MREKPFCSKRTVIAKTRLFTIEEMQLKFANGAHRLYERIRSHGHGAVMMVAITPGQSLLLVREYAAGTDTYELAFPKGLVDSGESCLDAANRELQEEVGFAAKKLTWLRSMTLAPGYFGARLDLVVAQQLYPSVLPGDEPELPEVVEWPVTAMEDLLLRPDFTEARSIAALYLIKDWLNKKEK